MNGHLLTLDGKELEPSQKEVEKLLASSEPFWLDLRMKGEDSPEFALLRDAFHFHPLALEDAAQFGQRSKLDSYDDFAFLVVFGPGQSDHLVEVHCFSALNFLVTVHRRACPSMDEVRRRMQIATTPLTSHIMVLYRVVDMLVDGYFPLLAALDDQIDELEDEILQAPTDEQLGRLFDMKRNLIVMRKVVTPERDVFATLVSSADVIPGMTPDYERYFRDVYDHLIRVSDLVDSYRDLPERGPRHPPVHRVQPLERSNETAHHHRHRILAPELFDRFFRAELWLDDRSDHELLGLLVRRRRLPDSGRYRAD